MPGRRPGARFTFKVGYAGSVYEDASNSYTVENPFCATGSGPGECASNGFAVQPASADVVVARQPGQRFHRDVGADLPAQSRYMGTVSYTMMRQNQAFLPFTNTPVYDESIPPGANAYTRMGARPLFRHRA